MIWQDIVITIVGIIFSLSLIPQVYFGFKEKVGPIKYQTSVPTFLGLFVLVFTYITLSLYYSAFMMFFTGCLWLLLAVQRAMYHSRKKSQ